MGIFTKKDGRIYVVHTVSKKQVWAPFGRGDVARLRAEAFDRDLQEKAGKTGAGTLTGGLSVAALWTVYRRDHRVRESTFRMDAYKMAVLVSKLGGFSADSLTTDHLHRYVSQREKEGVKRATIANEIRRLKAVLNWACNETPPLLLTNPISHFRVSGVEAPDIPAPPALAEVRRLIDYSPPHLYRALWIFWNTGIRPAGEMFRIRWTDVDLDYDSVRIRSAAKKGPAVRNVPINEDLKSQLLEWKKEDELAFPKKFPDCALVHYRNEPVMSLKKSFASAKIAAGITRRIRLYDFRHAFASIALQSGADLKSLSEILGHSRPDTTARHYQHVTKKQHRDVMSHIPKLSIQPSIPKNNRTA
jgi:integrase